MGNLPAQVVEGENYLLSSFLMPQTRFFKERMVYS